jgi:hypothetical protein
VVFFLVALFTIIGRASFLFYSTPSQHTRTRPTKRDGCLYNSHRVPRCWKHAPVIRAADLFVTGRFRVTSAGGEKDAS